MLPFIVEKRSRFVNTSLSLGIIHVSREMLCWVPLRKICELVRGENIFEAAMHGVQTRLDRLPNPCLLPRPSVSRWHRQSDARCPILGNRRHRPAFRVESYHRKPSFCRVSNHFPSAFSGRIAKKDDRAEQLICGLLRPERILLIVCQSSVCSRWMRLHLGTLFPRHDDCVSRCHSFLHI